MPETGDDTFPSLPDLLNGLPIDVPHPEGFSEANQKQVGQGGHDRENKAILQLLQHSAPLVTVGSFSLISSAAC